MKHSIVRETIIETASELFYQKGYNLTGINEIIKEAGIAKATLYNHFKSKDDICLAYLEHKNSAFLKELEDFISSKPKGKGQILAIFDFLELFYNSKDFNGCWCINTVSELPKEDDKIRSEIQEQKKQFLEFIEKIVRRTSPDKPTQENTFLASQIYLIYEGALSESYLHQDAWPIESAKKLCKRILE